MGIPSKEANNQPSSISSNKKPSQGVKQTPKRSPTSQKQGTSKLPRKVSAQPSNASDSVSVTSSIKDQDLLDDLVDSEADAASTRSESVDHDAIVFSNRHLQQDNPSLNGDIPFDSDEIDAAKSMVAGSPFDVPYRIMPPDILNETPYLSRHSVGIQVEDDSNLKAIKDLKEKGQNLHELIKQRTELCWQLQNQIDDNNVDFVAASVMVLAVVHKVRILFSEILFSKLFSWLELCIMFVIYHFASYKNRERIQHFAQASPLSREMPLDRCHIRELSKKGRLTEGC